MALRGPHEAPWLQLGDGVFARRYEHLNLTLGLVIGDDRCLVIDTGGDETQGARFAAAIRRLTPLPWLVVLTHAHFDHHFGTRPFLPCPVWAHERCRQALLTDAETDRAEWADRFRREGNRELANRLNAAELVLPTELFTDAVALDLGGRTVTLLHPGLGHTNHDVIAHVPDAEVVFARDLVEQGAPPQAGPDAYPAHWPHTLDRLLALRPMTVVPGHGEPVDAEFVRAQRAALSRS